MITNVVQGGGGKWRTMVDDGLYGGKMAVGVLYRAELAQGLSGLGYRIEKTRAGGRFEIVGVPRKVIEAFSTRRAEIGAAMKARDLGAPGDDPRLADRAALLTRARKRGVDKDALRDVRARQAMEPGFPVEAVVEGSKTGQMEARQHRDGIQDDLFTGQDATASEAVAWAVGHLSERQAVFSHADLLATTLGLAPGAVSVEAAEKAVGRMEAQGGLHAATGTNHRFLAHHAGLAAGRGTPKGLWNLRAAFDKTLLVVDESALASTKQVRDLLKVATVLWIPRVVLVGDEKQLDGVEAGAPFAQLKRAGTRTVVMDEIMRQRDADLKEAVRASLAGEVKTAFEKLGDRVSEVPKSERGIEVASRWRKGSSAERQTTGVIAPTRALRDEINETIRDRLIEEGAVHGPARRGEKLVSRGLTNAEMSRASNYAAGDTVIFNRRYKTLAVEKGDEREVAKVDHGAHTVHLKDGRGNIVERQPWRHAGAKGGVEVTGARRRNFAPATASGGHATIPAPGWSTGRWRKWNPSLGTACGSTSKTEAQWNSRTMMRNCRYPGSAGHGAEGTASTESAARAEGLRSG